MSLLNTCLVCGLLAGLYSAIWGTVKDTKFEKFRLLSFVRSPILGIICGLLVYIFLRNQPSVVIRTSVVIFLVCAGLERNFTEAYKQFFRQEKQKKYRIPQRFAIYGKVIKNYSVRVILGIIYIVGLVLFSFWWRHFIQSLKVDKYIGAALAASVGGVIMSVGGANKDAPKEGFGKIILFRSEALAVACGIALTPFTNDYIMLGWGASGAERTIIEFYKTFIRKKKPGKFK